MADYNVRVPPDSTGKRLRVTATVEISYDQRVLAWALDSTIVGSISGITGTLLRLEEDSPTTGTIHLLLHYGSPEAAAPGENFTVEGAITARAATAGTPFYTQNITLTGANNPFQGVTVDDAGALSTRFAEGSQQLDAFGLSRFSTPTILAGYNHKIDALGSQIQTITSGVGSAVFLSSESAVAMDVGSTLGDSVVRTTDLYHPYQPGFGQLIQMTVGVGDATKSGVTRRWGYYDDNDGMFFELVDSQLSVVIRSSTTGVVLETRTPQDEWNRDDLSGTGGAQNISKFGIDVSKINLYWIDFQWLGAGVVHFGVYAPKGERLVIHAQANANSNTTAYTRTGSLPLRWEIFNHASTASPSRLKVICASVATEGAIQTDRKGATFRGNFEIPSLVSIPDTEFLVLSVRPAPTYGGATFRGWINPEVMSILVQDHPVIFRFRKNSTISGETWTTKNAGQVAPFGTMDVPGEAIFALVFSPGSYNYDLLNLITERLMNRADGTPSVTYNFTAQCLEPTMIAKIYLAVSSLTLV